MTGEQVLRLHSEGLNQADTRWSRSIWVKEFAIQYQEGLTPWNAGAGPRGGCGRATKRIFRCRHCPCAARALSRPDELIRLITTHLHESFFPRNKP